MAYRYKKETVESFASLLTKKQHADWWELIACSGVQGVGKSCLLTQIVEEASKMNKMKFSYQDNLTWMRKEFTEWINGKGKDMSKRMPEFSAVLIDELISLFHKRNWINAEQNDAIELMNKCRDRHLIVGGNVPDFWDLDKGIRGLFTFWIHIPRRGIAWVFTPDSNPFEMDKWHVKFNAKQFGIDKNPYKCRGFIAEIHFDDWTPAKKKEYYDVRNTKRINTEGQGRKDNNNLKVLRSQRNKLISLFGTMKAEAKVMYRTDSTSEEFKTFLRDFVPASPEIGNLIGMASSNVRMIVNPNIKE
jgi:hypothetical protein